LDKMDPETYAKAYALTMDTVQQIISNNQGQKLILLKVYADDKSSASEKISKFQSSLIKFQLEWAENSAVNNPINLSNLLSGPSNTMSMDIEKMKLIAGMMNRVIGGAEPHIKLLNDVAEIVRSSILSDELKVDAIGKLLI
jgi:hypothetical protein